MRPRFIAQVEPYTPSVDSHNHAVDTWGEPVKVPIFGWGPASTAQAVEGNRSPVTSEVDVYAPAGTATGNRDRWTLGGVTYLQDGVAQDYTNGPFGTRVAGVVVRVKQVKG